MIDTKAICLLNLGREIEYDEDYKVMIVGYNEEDKFLIVSSSEKYGWTEVLNKDHILINSPLNVSYFYIDLTNRYWRFQLIMS